MKSRWHRELRKARNGAGHRWLEGLKLLPRRSARWRAALAFVGAAAAGALLLAYFTRGGAPDR